MNELWLQAGSVRSLSPFLVILKARFAFNLFLSFVDIHAIEVGRLGGGVGGPRSFQLVDLAS